MGYGRFLVSVEYLRDAMHLPESARILNIVMTAHSPNEYAVFVAHDDIPETAEGALPVDLHPTLKHCDGKVEFVGWGINLNTFPS